MLNRRSFLSIAGTAVMAGSTFAMESAKRPNLLWLSCEDISPHLGCYGCADAITPALDRLAAAGTRFDNAFASAPVCAPNRSCVITGVYAASLGSHHMRSGGKGNSRSPKPDLPEEVVPLPALLRQAGYYCTNNAKEDYNFEAPLPLWNESGGKAHWRKRPNPDQPFFAVFNFTGTHESMVRGAPEEVARATRALTPEQRRDPAEVAIPPYHGDTPATRRNWANYHELITALDYWVAELLNQLEADGLEEDTIVVFWSDHGHGLPRGKRWLYDSGTRIPLVVYVPEKWRGLAGLEAGQPDDRLVNCVDLAPSMLSLAGAPIPDFMQGQPFIGPEQPAPREYVFANRDRMDERYDMIRMVRDKQYKYIRNYRPDLPYNQHIDYAEQSPVKQDLNRLAAEGGLPPGAHWITYSAKPVEELYDLEQDPHELHNLAGAPEMEETLQRLRAAHEQWQEDIRDLGLMPEAELFRLQEAYGTRYRIYEGLERDHPGFWEELRRTAQTANQAQVEDMEVLRTALKSPHASLRYWAVIGLRQNPDNDALLSAALRDPSPLIAVLAAQRLLQRGAADAEAALEVLKAALSGEDEWAGLLAADALDTAGEKARAALPELRQALEHHENKYIVRIANHAIRHLTDTKTDSLLH